MHQKQLQVAVVGGLGKMASPMAVHWKDRDSIRVTSILDRGTQSPRHDLNRKRWQEAGVPSVSNYADLLGTADLDGVFVCCGKNGDDLPIVAALIRDLAKRNSRHPLFICHLSTVSNRFVESAYSYAQKQGVDYVNYTLTGGQTGAEKGSMLILSSGNHALYQRLESSLKLIGNPKYFGPRIDAAADVKFIGHLMVFGGLIGISSAIAVHAESFMGGQLGGAEQVEFFNFLNTGAGGTKQWDVSAAVGIRDGLWDSAFQAKFGLVDAIYVAERCASLGVSRLTFDFLVRVILALQFVMEKLNLQFATHAIIQGLIRSKAKELDAFLLSKLPAPNLSPQETLTAITRGLPSEVRASVRLDIRDVDFQSF